MGNSRLDVTRVLKAPQFKDVIDVIRNAESVDENGMIQIANITYPNISAVVTQSSGDIGRREQAGQRVEGTIMVYTMFHLSEGKDLGGVTMVADIVVYDGVQYTVKQVNDYSRWGKGFVAALCSLIPLNPVGPA